MATTVLGSYGTPDGFDQLLQRAWRTGGTQIVSDSMQTRRAQVVGLHITQRPGYEAVREELLKAGWETMAVVPMIYRGTGIGLLMVVCLPGTEPDADELAFFEAISDQAAVALENARLFEQAQSAAVNEERQRMSRELHDSVAAEPMEYVVSLANAALAEMRAMIFDLRPEALEQEGLVAALHRQAAAVEARHEILVETRFDGEPEIALEAKEAFYRIAQEALQNVVKHSRATNVALTFEDGPDGVTLKVQDNGRGFDVGADFPGHLGLTSMRERAAKVGATFVLESAPGEGSRVVVRLAVA
jgi:signal transduction histidine kinase